MYPRPIDASNTRQHITGDKEKALSLVCDSVLYGIYAHHSVPPPTVPISYRFNPNYVHGTRTQLRKTVLHTKIKNQKSKIKAQILTHGFETQDSLPSFRFFVFHFFLVRTAQRTAY